MAFLDPDDIIVPTIHNSLEELIIFLEKKHGYFSSFVMLQYMFPLWKPENN